MVSLMSVISWLSELTGSAAMAEDRESRFVHLALDVGALAFGSFTLKSGRQSPYFLNAGKFASGKATARGAVWMVQ